jgi:sugar phosphate isomerase/epimerase
MSLSSCLRRFFSNKRPITLTTGQFADLSLPDLAAKAKSWGFDGLELACWGDLFDVQKALKDPTYIPSRRAILTRNGLNCWALQAHLTGQAVLDQIDERHKGFVPAHVWGDGTPDGVNQRAALELADTARAAKLFGISVVTGFTGSSIWPYIYSFPAVPEQWIDRGFSLLAERMNPVLDVFGENGVKFALEVHPTEIAFDFYTAERALESLKGRPEFGFNFDPSHLLWQGIDPVQFLHHFKDRIYHVHMKDVKIKSDGRVGLLGSHLPFGDHRRGWDFRSLGHGSVNFEEIVRTLNDIGYQGPLSVEWEDMGMEREQGAAESCAFVKRINISPSQVAFDGAFDKRSQ